LESALTVPLPRALPRRPVLFPVLVVCGLTLCLGLALRGHSLRDCHLPLTAFCGLANLAAAVAILARARECPRESRGWRLLGLALILIAAANLAAGLDYRFPHLLGSHNVGPVILGVLSQSLAVAALVCLPWQSAGLDRRGRNVLGSILFVGSILLILWTVTNWEEGFGSHNVVNLALVAACVRLALLGGVALLLLEQDPRRIHGVLGFFLLNSLLGAIYIALLQALLVRGALWTLPFASAYSAAPLILGLAAWSRAPLEFPTAPARTARVWAVIPYVTFALGAVAILLEYLVTGKVNGAPLTLFISLTWLLLFRQFLLLRELRANNLSLERRVIDRTCDLERMQATVLRTERLNTIASLGAGIAHDLNNFLGVIHSSAGLILQDLESARLPERRHLDRIHASSERAAALTGRLLCFARKESEPPMVLDLGQELTQMEDLLRMLLPRTIELRLDLARGPFPLLTLRSNLEQILVNLVSNARDAMADGGTITLRLATVPGPQGPLIQFQVDDDGPGLPPLVMAHLFEFFITTKAEGKGTGLGLATVKALVTGDRGQVAVLSEPDSGCRFTITYPLAVEG